MSTDAFLMSGVLSIKIPFFNGKLPVIGMQCTLNYTPCPGKK